MTSFDEALAAIFAEVNLLPSVRISLELAAGTVLAEPVQAPIDLPPFDNSAVDGFAVHFPVRGSLALVDEVPAGREAASSVGPGEAVRIFTGAPLPTGTDAVVMQEDANVQSGFVTVLGNVTRGSHIRRRGEELRVGDVVLRTGHEVSPATMGVLATLGLEALTVTRPLRMLIVTTGNELVPPGQPLAPGQVYASNGIALACAARALGAEPTTCHVPDDREEVREALRLGKSGFDMVITAGGVSVGKYDLVREAWHELGLQERFWRISIKPGKPVLFGRFPDGPLVFGLPGNPVSALVTFHLLVRPAIRAMRGLPEEVAVPVRLSEPLRAADGRDEFVRVRIEKGVAIPLERQGSHMASGLADADALVRVRSGASLGAGDPADAIMLRWAQ